MYSYIHIITVRMATVSSTKYAASEVLVTSATDSLEGGGDQKISEQALVQVSEAVHLQ